MHPELKAQTIVAEQNKNDRSFIDPVNFYESERNSGYKNTGNALYEIIDNNNYADFGNFNENYQKEFDMIQAKFMAYTESGVTTNLKNE